MVRETRHLSARIARPTRLLLYVRFFSVCGLRVSLLGVRLPTLPKESTLGLQYNLWRGQETGHSRRFTAQDRLLQINHCRLQLVLDFCQRRYTRFAGLALFIRPPEVQQKIEMLKH